MRAALMLGLPCAARQIGRARRFCRELLVRAGHEAGRGNVVTAAGRTIRVPQALDEMAGMIVPGDGLPAEEGGER